MNPHVGVTERGPSRFAGPIVAVPVLPQVGQVRSTADLFPGGMPDYGTSAGAYNRAMVGPVSAPIPGPVPAAGRRGCKSQFPQYDPPSVDRSAGVAQG